MQHDLIFDVGAHRGEDTEFYLKKGFRVVGIEADPELYGQLRRRFADEIANGRLVLLNVAVAEQPGPITFYRNLALSVWGTIYTDWVERNRGFGTESVPITVEGRRFASIVAEFGVPYYAKIDIEGADTLCLEGFLEVGERPRYISIEASRTSWRELQREFSLLRRLGYTKFKVVKQSGSRPHRLRFPAREGIAVNHRFQPGSSGPFGEESAGRWRTAAQALALYRLIFITYALFSERGIVTRYNLGQRLVRRLRLTPGWYDTHAS